MEKNKNIIIGFHSGHDCSYCILENGVPIIHEELERITRLKEGNGDGLKLFLDRNPNLKDENLTYSHCFHCDGNAKTSAVRSLGDENLFDNMVENNDYYEVGHHLSHAAHAYYSSRFNNSLIISLDSGGWDINSQNDPQISSVAVYRGKDNKISPTALYPIHQLCVGPVWAESLEPLFGLSSGPPKGNQAGTIMAMAAIGKYSAFEEIFYNSFLTINNFKSYHPEIVEYINQHEDNKYNVAKGIQKATEAIIKDIVKMYIKPEDKTICFTGGVSLNSVCMGKISEWFPQIEEVFIPIVPYDGGLSIGSAQYVYHHIQNNPKLSNDNYFKPYLGINYSKEVVNNAIEEFKDKIIIRKKNDSEVIKLLSNNNIVSIFNEKSESGRRALGNRSILADPRSNNMKDLINEKVKHRQWFRPFAPSILKEEVSNWFEYEVDSPYMGVVVPFKIKKRDKVPAVVHLDGTGRLQTVSEDINKWYYNFLKLWHKESGVPILLNTSFNDREPIVETPTDAIKCYLGTNIDYLYFPEHNILINKR